MILSSLPTLTSQLAAGRLALFVGADLPAALTGLPSRADLARGLAERHGLDPALRLAAAAQRVMQGGNRFAFTDYLGRQLDPLGHQPRRFHQLLAQLPVRAIITTAYDSLLELAFQQAGEPLDILVRDSDVAFADPQRRTLIKLYGDARQRDTLIVTEDDHYGLWRSRERESLLNEVRSVLSRHALLFLGYDLADPDFNLLWRELLDRMGRFAMGAYAVWPGAPVDERRVWEDRQVRVIDEQPLEFLERLLAVVSGGPAGRAEARVQAGDAITEKQEPDQMSQLNRAAFRQLLAQHFDDGELRTLCFDLGIEYENLPGGGKEDKVRELIAYCARHNRNADLIALCVQLRPQAPWQDAALGFVLGGTKLRAGPATATPPTEAKADASIPQQTSAPPIALPAEPTPAPAPPVLPAAGGFSHEHGLATLRQRLERDDDETRLAFAVLETRLRENLRDDRLYGPNENVRSERARIVHELNRLALNQAGPSFNELCGG